MFFFKQKTAYEMRISDWSSDVCSSDLVAKAEAQLAVAKSKADAVRARFAANQKDIADLKAQIQAHAGDYLQVQGAVKESAGAFRAIASESLISAQAPERLKTIDALADNEGYPPVADLERYRSEEHTSELQSQMR